MSDAINPQHDKHLPAEAIDIILASIAKAPSNQAAYLQGLVLRYLLRCWEKDGFGDLQKAKWYLDRLVNHDQLAEVAGPTADLPIYALSRLPKYREPTQADLNKGSIACQYRGNYDNLWKSGFLAHIFTGSKPYLCSNEKKLLTGRWPQCRIEVTAATPDLPIANADDKQQLPTGYRWIERGERFVDGDFSIDRIGNNRLITRRMVGYAVEVDQMFIRKIEELPKRYREPTRSDLASGPIDCEVRDCPDDEWLAGILSHVHDSPDFGFFAKTKNHGFVKIWHQCRIEVTE